MADTEAFHTTEWLKSGHDRTTESRNLLCWRKEYGGVHTDQVRRLKELEKENVRLKKVVADLTLDNAILKEAAYSSF